MKKKSYELDISILGKTVNEHRQIKTKLSICELIILDSTNLEIFLENLEDNVIVIAVTFDEASQK